MLKLNSLHFLSISFENTLSLIGFVTNIFGILRNFLFLAMFRFFKGEKISRYAKEMQAHAVQISMVGKAKNRF